MNYLSISSWQKAQQHSIAWQDSAEALLSEYLRWLLHRSADAYVWLQHIFRTVVNGSFSDLAIMEVVICLVLLIFAIRIILKVFDALRSDGDLEHNTSSKRVLLSGRWTVTGYESPLAAEERRRRWRSKLMSPQEQQRYIEQVQRGEISEADGSATARNVTWTIFKYLSLIFVISGLLLYFAPTSSDNRGEPDRSRIDKPKEPVNPQRTSAQKSSKIEPETDASSEKEVTKKQAQSLVSGTVTEGTVVQVIDGDLVMVQFQDGRFELQLQGIDAPELEQPHGKRAKLALRKWVEGKIIKIKADKVTIGGRMNGVVYHKDENINTKMVCAGHAWWSEVQAPGEAELKQCQRNAKIFVVGLWRDSNPVPPWEWRERKR